MNKEPLTPSSYVSLLTNCLTFLVHTWYLTSLKRRDLLKPKRSKNFPSLCPPSKRITIKLFDNDLSNKVATKIIGLKQQAKVFMLVEMVTRETLLAQVFTSILNPHLEIQAETSQPRPILSEFIGVQYSVYWFRNQKAYGWCDVVEFPYVVLGAFALTCFSVSYVFLIWTFIKTIQLSEPLFRSHILNFYLQSF